MPKSQSDDRNRDDQQKAGSPPRPATEPDGGKGSSSSGKTATDPATGAPAGGTPSPNQAD